MFDSKKEIALVAKELHLSPEDAEELVKRLRGWIKSNGDSTKSIARGLGTILKNIRSKAIEQKKEHRGILTLSGVKNPILLKYASKIIQLKEQGYGARRIAQHLKTFHNAKISHTTIHKFLKLQEENHG